MKRRSQRRQPFSPERVLPWRSLQWRLTGLYLVASILTSLLIQTAIAAFYTYTYVYSSLILDETLEMIAQAEPQVARFFAGESPDVPGLTRWLDRQHIDEGFPGVGFLEGRREESQTIIAIANVEGNVLTATPEGSSFPPGTRLDEHCTPQERDLLALARQGIRQARRVSGRVIAAAPIRQEGRIIAVGLVRSGDHYTLRHALLGSSLLLFSSAILTALGGAIIGGAFGYVTARSVQRRLLEVTAVLQRWSSGDLKALVPASSADEFGLLGRNLNAMAANLEQMILLRRRVAVLEERQKITRDLHDTVKQQAFATAMLIGSAREHFRRGANDELGRNLMEVEELARRMQEDLRTILQEMRAATLLPLPRQLMQMAEEWSRQTGLPIHRRIAPEAENLSPVLSEQVARIVGEALSNVAKHSHATQVELAFERIGDLWSLLIADNGQGIAEKSTRGMGIGLQTMRERARELPEGHLEIVNAPLGGTRVTLTFREVDL